MKTTGLKSTKKRVSHKPDATPRKLKKNRVNFVLDDDDKKLQDETVKAGGFVSGGDGKGGHSRATITQFYRYCLHHINDNKEIKLSPKKIEKVDALINAIADNRKPLDEGLQDVKRMHDDFYRVAVNLNQAVKQINTLMWLQRENEIDLETCLKKMEDVVDYLGNILNGYGDGDGWHVGLKDYLQKADELLEPIRSQMQGVLDREDKILARLII